MRLINTHTSKSLIEFKGEKTIIHNRYLEQEMRTIGIPVPHGLRGVYHGKDSICLDDEDFQKAFKEIYYLTAMSPEKFHWVE
jgi:hypothetical protein